MSEEWDGQRATVARLARAYLKTGLRPKPNGSLHWDYPNGPDGEPVLVGACGLGVLVAEHLGLRAGVSLQDVVERGRASDELIWDSYYSNDYNCGVADGFDGTKGRLGSGATAEYELGWQDGRAARAAFGLCECQTGEVLAATLRELVAAE